MRILLVEDNRQLRTSIVRGLQEASYLVDAAADGAQALEMAARSQYDAVILDILLPEVDGIAVCRKLREREEWVPILMLTALDAVEHRITGLDAGADDYLPKPFDFGELLARLRAVTRRRSDGESPEIRVGDLTVDTRRHRVHRGNREIALTAKEFALLSYLARNAGRVVTKSELAARVWDDNPTQSNVIDVYASRLRKKIDDGESTPLFTTLRGSGYILEANPSGPERD